MATNPYYQNTFSGQPGQTARAEAVDQQFAGVESAFTGATADIVRALKGAVGETLNDMPAAAVRANKWLRFDSNGQPLLAATPLNWRGLWQPFTLYNVGDAVQIGLHQSLVYCVTQHTSGASYVGTDWTTFVDLTGVPFNNYGLLNTAGSFQLNKGDSYFLDCTAGAMTINMPLSPVLGDTPINLTHVGGSLSGSQTIMLHAPGGFNGISNTDVNVDVVNASMTIAYAGASYGWRLRVMG